MTRVRLLVLTGVMLPATVTGARVPAVEPTSASVPLVLDHGRITVEAQLGAAGATAQTARAWIDTGGTAIVLAEPLARALGVEFEGLPDARETSVETKAPAPSIRIGGIALDTEGLMVSIRAGRFALPGVQAECIVPARCLRKLRVVFDYPGRTLKVAAPGTLKPQGTPGPCRVNATTGLFMADGMIDGQPVALGIDTGSAGTWVSDTLAAAWLARHADWPSAVGAAGSTNFFGFPFEAKGRLLRLPALTIGPVTATDVAVLGVMPQLFDWYSRKSASEVTGFVGAALLARYRLEVDFPAGTCWWQAGPARASRDLSMVGLTIRPDADGSYTVAGVVSRGGRPVVDGVEVGDRLVRVGTLDTLDARMGDVIDALRGEPGETRTLVVERAGTRVAVAATVMRLP